MVQLQQIPAFVISKAKTFASKAWPEETPTICELNIRSGLHASSLCSEMEYSKYVGIAFEGNTSSPPLVDSILHSMRKCVQSRLLTPGPALYSARAVLGSAIDASCHIIIVEMDAQTASARQTLILEVHMALRLASPKVASMLVMVGTGCDSKRTRFDNQDNYIISGEQYYNAYRAPRGEQCWVQSAWSVVRARNQVAPPAVPEKEPNECERIGTRLWCVGELMSARHSLCRSTRPLLEFGDAAEARRCDVNSEPVVFSRASRAPQPEWDPSRATPRFAMFRSFEDAIRLGIRDYAMIPCGPGPAKRVKRSLSLIFNNVGDEDRWVAGIVSHDAGQSFQAAQAHLVMFAGTNESSAKHLGVPYHMTANLAIVRDQDEGRYAIVGGRYRSPFDEERGVFMATGESWRWSSGAQEEQPPTYAGRGKFYPSPVQPAGNWREFRLLFDGNHSGCIENNGRDRRNWRILRRTRDASGESFNHVCGFSGRLSLVRHNDRWLVYTSATLGRNVQGVQMTRSSEEGWQPFQLLRVGGLEWTALRTSHFEVQTNPVHPGTLLALVPLVHCGGACIGITFSVDGLEWSPLRPIVGTTPWLSSDGARTSSRPVAGGLVMVGRVRVACFIHEHVPRGKDEINIRFSPLSTWELAQWNKVHPVQRRSSPSKIVRIEFPCSRLALWTSRGLRTLEGGPELDQRSLYLRECSNFRRWRPPTEDWCSANEEVIRGNQRSNQRSNQR